MHCWFSSIPFASHGAFLQSLSKSPASRAEVLPRHPSCGVAGEEHGHIGDLSRIADAVERRQGSSFVAIAVLHHVRFRRARRNRVDGDASGAEFPCQAANELLDRTLAAEV